MAVQLVRVSTFPFDQDAKGNYPLLSSVIEATTGVRDNTTEYRTSVYYTTIDTQLEDLNNRFSETNLSLHC